MHYSSEMTPLSPPRNTRNRFPGRTDEARNHGCRSDNSSDDKASVQQRWVKHCAGDDPCLCQQIHRALVARLRRPHQPATTRTIRTKEDESATTGSNTRPCQLRGSGPEGRRPGTDRDVSCRGVALQGSLRRVERERALAAAQAQS